MSIFFLIRYPGPMMNVQPYVAWSLPTSSARSAAYICSSISQIRKTFSRDPGKVVRQLDITSKLPDRLR